MYDSLDINKVSKREKHNDITLDILVVIDHNIFCKISKKIFETFSETIFYMQSCERIL